MSNVIHFVSQDNETPSKRTVAGDVLSKLEQTSINALVAYTAFEHKVEEALVVSITTSHFGVDNISKIHRHDYDAAIRYLVDLNLKEQIN